MIDTITYLDSRSVDYYTTGKNIAPGWVGLQCPNPNCGDRSTHFGIHIATGNFSCFRCGIKGNAVKLITLLEHCSYGEAKAIASEFEAPGSYQKERTHAPLVELPKSAKKPLPNLHRRYLEKRNFDSDLLTEKYDLYGCELGKDYQFRLIIPVYQKKRIVTFTARAVVENADLRYKNCPVEKSVLSIKDCLYNIDSVKDTAIVVEGVFDAWRIGDSACATFGTKVTPTQISLLTRCKNVFVMFDATAIKEAEQLANQLAGIVDHVEIITITAKDPAEMSEKEINYLRRNLLS
jgi:DNA primase